MRNKFKFINDAISTPYDPSIDKSQNGSIVESFSSLDNWRFRVSRFEFGLLANLRSCLAKVRFSRLSSCEQ